MRLSSRNPRTLRHLLIMLVCSTTLICAARAEAFSSGPQTQTVPEIAPGRLSANPALITDNSRDPLKDNDFLRITFLPNSVEVRTPGRPGVAVRSFFGSTRFYEPPIAVTRIADFNGFAPKADLDLVAMRCQPHLGGADPRLATWPNLAQMIVSDFADQHFPCNPPNPSVPANLAFCLASAYADVATQPVVIALISALQLGQALFTIKSGDFIFDTYGIDANHSGLGFVVKGLPVPLNAAETLEKSVVPEYLLKNINLADANCRCIRVAPYTRRDQDVLPANLIWARGKLGPNGLCSKYVKRLP